MEINSTERLKTNKKDMKTKSTENIIICRKEALPVALMAGFK